MKQETEITVYAISFFVGLFLFIFIGSELALWSLHMEEFTFVEYVIKDIHYIISSISYFFSRLI